MTFQLSSASAPAVSDPAPGDIDRVVERLDNDNFWALITTAEEQRYAQVGYGPNAGAAAGVYALEYRDGSPDAHFRAETREPAEAKSFLRDYRAGDERWKRGHAWQAYSF